ncbi:MAG: phytanoyl-CoA dioxygenase family protein, partial [SAR324 cluster bacterium]|nr:phytanoyl-CoA dioxygenase family protein [SAR324 cluster bacterium]
EDPTPKSIAGMTELYHHQAIWNNRQFPKVYDVFFDLWGTEKLWTTIDRVNMNLPNQKGWDFGGFLHWDVELDQLLVTRNIQGVLSLNDNDTGMGGLQIIPTLFQQLESWLEGQPKGRSRMLEEKVDFEVINVPSKAGDLVIWDTRMAHGTSPNHSSIPRFAQYLSMCPAEPEHDELLEIRLASFANQTRPEKSGNKISGTAGFRKESDFCPKAELTELGKRLLGVQPW